ELFRVVQRRPGGRQLRTDISAERPRYPEEHRLRQVVPRLNLRRPLNAHRLASFHLQVYSFPMAASVGRPRSQSASHQTSPASSSVPPTRKSARTRSSSHRASGGPPKRARATPRYSPASPSAVPSKPSPRADQIRV